MILNVDLLSIPCAEYCERNGVKGVFIPEVPNFRFSPESRGKRGQPAMATLTIDLFKTKYRTQKTDYLGKMRIWPEYQDAYMANPNTVSRRKHVAYGYNLVSGRDESPAPVSGSGDFERLLKD